jgi:hypothetical protein
MHTQLGALSAAVRSVARLIGLGFRPLIVTTIAALTLGGCFPRPSPLVGADPADPGAKVSGVGYRSTVGPYTSLRPVAPSSWREQNDRAAPSSKSGQ